MGGFIALGALTHDPRIKAVVTVVGSPVWTPRFACDLPEMEELKKHSPAAMPEKFFPCPVFMANAGLDRTIPIAPVRSFVQTIAPYYAADPERFATLNIPIADMRLTSAPGKTFCRAPLPGLPATFPLTNVWLSYRTSTVAQRWF